MWESLPDCCKKLVISKFSIQVIRLKVSDIRLDCYCHLYLVLLLLHTTREGLVLGYNAAHFHESPTAKTTSTFEVYDGKTKICPIFKPEKQL